MNGEKRNCIRPKIVTSNPKIAVPWAGSAEKLRVNVGRTGIVIPNPRVSRMILTKMNVIAAWRVACAPARFLTVNRRRLESAVRQARGEGAGEQRRGRARPLTR